MPARNQHEDEEEAAAEEGNLSCVKASSFILCAIIAAIIHTNNQPVMRANQSCHAMPSQARPKQQLHQQKIREKGTQQMNSKTSGFPHNNSERASKFCNKEVEAFNKKFLILFFNIAIGKE